MSNEWNEQGRDESHGPGPQFDAGVEGPSDPYSQPSHEQQWQQNQQYGQGGPGQQPYPPQQPYPAQQPYGAQQPYPAQQPYAAQPSWAQNPYDTVAPPNRSGVLGVVGLVVVVLATGALMASAWFLGVGLGDFLVNLSETGVPRDPEDLVNDPRTIAYAETAVGTIGAAVLSCIAGLIGWVISIVATATRRGRVWGIVGIVLGVLALPLAYGIMMLALTPVINSLG